MQTPRQEESALPNLDLSGKDPPEELSVIHACGAGNNKTFCYPSMDHIFVCNRRDDVPEDPEPVRPPLSHALTHGGTLIEKTFANLSSPVTSPIRRGRFLVWPVGMEDGPQIPMTLNPRFQNSP